jgi:beta-lactamase regulating signal transducer with metallopeptidase domain/5-hydroxyisourate hydrolase-like protein (transthyretin family)
MIFLLNCAIKVSVILLVTLVAARLLRGRSAALRHGVLAAGMLSAAITPGLSVVVPGWTWSVVVEPPAPIIAPSYSAIEEPPSTNRPLVAFPLPAKTEEVATVSAAPIAAQPQTQSAQQSSYSLTTGETLALIWVVGFSVVFAVLLFGYAHLKWITRGSHLLNSDAWTRIAGQVAREYGLPQSPCLLQKGGLSVLFTWGWRRPRILVPESAPSWPVERIHAVLCHELAHVRRGDWLVQMTAELVRAVYWFNPLLWIACRSLRREGEQACDDAALNSGITGSDYAGHLLDVVRSLRQPKRSWSLALSMAGPSTLEQRFVAMLNPSTNRQTLSRWSLAAILAAFVAVTFPLSVLTGATVPAEPALTLPAFAGAAVPLEAWQNTPQIAGREGSVQGTVRRMGSGEPIPGVEIALDGGPADEKLAELIVRGLANAGVVFRPTRLGTVEELLQEALDAAGARGVGPGFPRLQEGLNNFQIASAGRFTAVSDKDGRFSIPNVPGGEYRIRPERDGFFPDANPENVSRVTVIPNQMAEATVSLAGGGVMSGRVIDALGRPVQDAVVDALIMTYENGYPVLRTSVTKTTDDQGEYRLFWLVPGEYYLQVTPPTAPGSAGPGPRMFYPGVLDTTGATPLVVRGNDKLSGLDVQLRNTRLAKLSGVLTSTIPMDEMERQGRLYVGQGNNSRPSLMLVSRDPNKPDVTGGGARFVGAVALNEGTGKFETQGILPGSYFLLGRLPANNANGGAGFAFGRVAVEVGNDDIGGLAIKVDRMVDVVGRVTVDGRVPQNVPVRVTLRVDDSAMKIGIYSALSGRYTPVTENGEFRMIGVPPGPYHVDVGPGLPPGFYVSNVRLGARNVFDSGFEIGSQAPDPLLVEVSSGAGTVEGVVQNAAGKPVVGVTVVLAPPENRRQNRVLFHQVVTDKNGRFTIPNVAPGGYKLFSWQRPLPAGTWFNEGFMARHEANGRPVNVAQGGTLTQQITVIP